MIVLPGFGDDSINSTIGRSLALSLEEQGWKKEQVCVFPVERSDWLSVFNTRKNAQTFLRKIARKDHMDSRSTTAKAQRQKKQFS